MKQVILFLLGIMNGLPIAAIVNYKLGLYIVNNSQYSLFTFIGYECTKVMYLVIYSLFIVLGIGITAWTLNKINCTVEKIKY